MGSGSHNSLDGTQIQPQLIHIENSGPSHSLPGVQLDARVGGTILIVMVAGDNINRNIITNLSDNIGYRPEGATIAIAGQIMPKKAKNTRFQV